MKILYIVRHAKASPKNLPIEDFYRPLYDRGITDAIKMGKVLFSEKHILDTIISSPASRAIATARSIAEQLKYDIKKITQQDDFYEAYSGELIDFTKKISNNFSKVMLVGHNPSLTEMAMQLCAAFKQDMDTCGVVAIAFNCESWSEVSNSNSNLLFYKYPQIL